MLPMLPLVTYFVTGPTLGYFHDANSLVLRKMSTCYRCYRKTDIALGETFHNCKAMDLHKGLCPPKPVTTVTTEK